MVNELAGKVAIVTGGASGIGRGTVERFVAEGARVVIADVDTDRGQALAEALGNDAFFVGPMSPTPTRWVRWWPLLSRSSTACTSW